MRQFLIENRCLIAFAIGLVIGGYAGMGFMCLLVTAKGGDADGNA